MARKSITGALLVVVIFAFSHLLQVFLCGNIIKKVGFRHLLYTKDLQENLAIRVLDTVHLPVGTQVEDMKIVVLVVPVVQEDLVVLVVQEDLAVLMVLVTVVALEDLVPNDVLPVVNKDVLQVLVTVLKNVLLELKVVPVVLVGQDVLVELKDVLLEENNAVLQVNMVPVLQMQNVRQKCVDREDLVVLAFVENQEDVTGNIDL